MKKLFLFLCLLVFGLTSAVAQPRIVEKKADDKTPAAIAPQTFKVKYEGGMFGFSKKQNGTLKFDDANFRLVFFDKDNKEQFGIPYSALAVIYPNTQSVQSNTGKVVQYIPIMGAGIAGQFIKKKLQYMVLNFDDVDIDVKGTITFKLESSPMLLSVIETLGNKAEMQKRGDAFYRPAKKPKETN